MGAFQGSSRTIIVWVGPSPMGRESLCTGLPKVGEKVMG